MDPTVQKTGFICMTIMGLGLMAALVHGCESDNKLIQMKLSHKCQETSQAAAIPPAK